MKKEKSKENTLEVSIVGGKFERYELLFPVDFPLGSFLLIKSRDEEHEILVKVRGYSDKSTENVLERYQLAPSEKVKTLMVNMVKGYLFEKKAHDVKIVDSKLDINKGHLGIDYIADKKYSLNKIGAYLATILHVRVDFNQVGARDYARKVGGLGPCGRELCCKSFLRQIPSITLDMAREQYLFSSPDRLSGMCGRLRCCLRYEIDFYREARKQLPEPGQMIRTSHGTGKVVEVNALVGRFSVIYEDGTAEAVYLQQDEKIWEPV